MIISQIKFPKSFYFQNFLLSPDMDAANGVTDRIPSVPVKIKVCIARRNESFVLRYLLGSSKEWLSIREDSQPIDQHPVLLSKSPVKDALLEINRQRTFTLFLSPDESKCYSDNSLVEGSLDCWKIAMTHSI